MSCVYINGSLAGYFTDEVPMLLTGEIGSYIGFTIVETPCEQAEQWRAESEYRRLLRSKRPGDKLRAQQLQRKYRL